MYFFRFAFSMIAFFSPIHLLQGRNITDPMEKRETFTFPNNNLSEEEKEGAWKGRIVILWSGLGEYAWALRIKNSCERLGWECYISIDPAEHSDYDKLVAEKPSTADEIHELIEDVKPDCVISLKWDRIYTKDVPNYLAATGVFKAVANPFLFEEGKIDLDLSVDTPENLLRFDGFLLAVDGEPLERFCHQNNKPFRSMRWLPSCGATEYRPIEPRTLFHCGFLWDHKRSGKEYIEMYSLLDDAGYFDLYGPKEKWGCAKNSVRGMTFDEEEFRSAMQRSGIVLILHTERNLNLGAPAARIFEAAAASCVVISDRNPFVEREFGDSVLYIDHELPGKELFQQIDNHVRWILQNREEAISMAKKAHAIFMEKFTLEQQLQELKLFHTQIDSNLPR